MRLRHILPRLALTCKLPQLPHSALGDGRLKTSPAFRSDGVEAHVEATNKARVSGHGHVVEKLDSPLSSYFFQGRDKFILLVLTQRGKLWVRHSHVFDKQTDRRCGLCLTMVSKILSTDMPDMV